MTGCVTYEWDEDEQRFRETETTFDDVVIVDMDKFIEIFFPETLREV